MTKFTVPNRLKIGLTPKEFDEFRHQQDPIADNIAKSIHEFSRVWAERELGETPKYQTEEKRQAIQSAKAYEFFAEIENAIANPNLQYDPKDKTSYRYHWDKSIIQLAKEKQSDAIDKLDEYFNDYDIQENDPFKFLFEDHVQEALKRGSKIMRLYGPLVLMVLGVRSLLKQYAAFNAANVLVSTKFLARFPHRRIFETMKFLIDVITPGNLEKDGVGIYAIKKLRLVHALVRYRIANKENINKKFTNWNSRLWGKPINQADMIAGLHTFSVEIIRGLQKVGYFLDLTESHRLKFSGEESEITENKPLSSSSIKEDYYLAWHYIGKALGVDDRINPKSYDEGWELQQYIYHTQFKLGEKDSANSDLAHYPNLSSVVLADPLINFMVDVSPIKIRRKDALALVYVFNDEEDLDPIFHEILGLDVKGLASTKFINIINGVLNTFDKYLECKYGVTPKYGIGKSGQIKNVDSWNIAIFKIIQNRVREKWSGSFTLRDGVDNVEGLKAISEKGKKEGISGALNLFNSYILGLLLQVGIFIAKVLGPLLKFVPRWLEREGRDNERNNYNDKSRFQEYFNKFLENNKDQIEAGHIDPNGVIVQKYNLTIPDHILQLMPEKHQKVSHRVKRKIDVRCLMFRITRWVLIILGVVLVVLSVVFAVKCLFWLVSWISSMFNV